jgi:hypothetical protein
MKEDFLHYLWERKHIRHNDLFTTEGQPLQILDWGFYNDHDGPDFLNARVSIDGTTWAGNIEMHLRSSIWLEHGHGDDPRFENVILHVVLEEDVPIRRRDGSRIACLELKKLIPPALIGKYLKLISLASWVPCQKHIHEAPEIIRRKLLETRLVERLEYKSRALREIAVQCKFDWELVLYRAMAENFGFKINAEAMRMLSERVSLKILRKHRGKRSEIEALLFGCAGLLNRVFTDDYPVQLQKQFHHFTGKYDLQPISENYWKWKQSRPANFPVVRISQFADFIENNPHLISTLTASETLKEIRECFKCAASPYFDTHYSFDRPSAKKRKTLGNASIDRILINTVLPFLFLYGKERELDRYPEKVLCFFEEIKAENNRITRNWEAIGMPHEHAGHSQALIQLKTRHCDSHLCLRCAVGNAILASPGT